MADPSARRRPSFDFRGCGFGPLYNAARPPKQAKDPHKSLHRLSIFPDWDAPGFACGGGCAYLGVAKRLVRDLMSAVERLEPRDDETPPRRDAEPAEISVIEAQLTQATAERSARLRPLLALAPYVARYRGRAVLALISLTVAAITTLIVPIAVRRMIDFGFTPEGIALINSYFSVMIAVVAVLAFASASRFYLVMTIGERIVADLRRDVFSHLMSLSPAFFDSSRSGELISRLTADTTQIKSAVGASVSIALRNFMLFIGATVMMVITSPRLSGFVLLAIPVIVIPLVAFGRWVRRLSRNAQDTLADATSYASELLGAIRTVQAYTSERLAASRFGRDVEQAYEAARSSTG